MAKPQALRSAQRGPARRCGGGCRSRDAGLGVAAGGRAGGARGWGRVLSQLPPVSREGWRREGRWGAWGEGTAGAEGQGGAWPSAGDVPARGVRSVATPRPVRASLQKRTRLCMYHACMHAWCGVVRPGIKRALLLGPRRARTSGAQSCWRRSTPALRNPPPTPGTPRRPPPPPPRDGVAALLGRAGGRADRTRCTRWHCVRCGADLWHRERQFHQGRRAGAAHLGQARLGERRREAAGGCHARTNPVAPPLRRAASTTFASTLPTGATAWSASRRWA